MEFAPIIHTPVALLTLFPGAHFLHALLLSSRTPKLLVAAQGCPVLFLLGRFLSPNMQLQHDELGWEQRLHPTGGLMVAWWPDPHRVSGANATCTNLQTVLGASLPCNEKEKALPEINSLFLVPQRTNQSQ